MDNDNALINWLSIRLAPDMTRPRFYNLMSRFASPDAVFGASAKEIAAVRGFDQKLAGVLLAAHGGVDVHRQAEQLASLHIRVLTRDDPDYPINLKQSSLAPPLLFVKGSLVPEDKYSIAMVGSRHATQYGRGVAREISAGLARCGMTIVSGFARGVDGEAHSAALKAGGRTIAVLGNGLDVCYPSEHFSLIEKVAAAGALITEYPLGTAPEKYNFPERNHVIAALSLGTLVVEAAEKSGSLITARLAVEENRFIFAIPGDITRNNSRGANALIQQGARMVQRPQDVLTEMKDVLRGYLTEDQLDPELAELTATNTAKKKKRNESRDWVDDATGADEAELEQLVAQVQHDDRRTEFPLAAKTPEGMAGQIAGQIIAAATAERKRKATAPPSSLTEDEEFILSLLHHEAMVFDELAEQSYGHGIDVPRLSSLLMKLELRQVIRQLPGRYYVLFA